MSRIYLLAHPAHWCQEDFMFAGTHIFAPSCEVCDGTRNQLVPPLLYRWEEDFGTPYLSMEKGHDRFWGDLYLIVTERGKAILEKLGLPFEFAATQFVKTRMVRMGLIIEELPAPKELLLWARPTNFADADPRRSGNEVCRECGRFTKNLRQLTRLRIPESDATAVGLFSVRQNYGGPIFVTEETKARLRESGLKGIGFVPAGTIV